MLPPQTRTADVGSGRNDGGLFLDERGEGGRTGAFGDGLLALEQEEDGVGDLLFVDGDDVVDVAVDDGEGEVAGAAHGDAVGDGGGGVEGDGVVVFDGLSHRRQARGLDADDLDGGA